MYKVRFILQVHSNVSSGSSDDVWLERVVELPFPPMPGLIYISGDWEAMPEAIYWDIDNHEFRAYVEPDKTIYYALLHHQEPPSLQEVVDDWLECGWERKQ